MDIEIFYKVRKVLGYICISILLLGIARSFSVQPLANKLLNIERADTLIEWESSSQIDENSKEFTYTLPDTLKDKSALLFGTYWTDASVYVGDTCIFEYTDPFNDLGYTRQWVDLYEYMAGQTLSVVYTGNEEEIAVSASMDVFCGDASDVIQSFVQGKMYVLIFFFITLIMTFVIMYVYFATRKRIDHDTKKGFLALGGYVFTIGIYIVSDSHIAFLWTKNAAVNTLFTFSSLTLFMVLLTIFISEMFYHRIKALDYLTILFMLDYIFILSTYLLRILPPNTTQVTCHLLQFVTVLVVLYEGFKELFIRKSDDKQYKIIMIGLMVMVLFGLLSLVMFYSKSSKYAIPLCVGIVVFTAFLIWLFYERLYVVLEKEAKTNAYRDLAYKDTMTGVGNRTAYNNIIEQLDGIKNVGLVAMDINNLKHTNDTYGHQEGDILIESAAKCIVSTFEDVGQIYRIGGDEFEVIIFGTDAIKVQSLLVKLTKKVEEMNASLSDRPWNLEIAYGYSVCCGTNESKNIEQLIKIADDRMYECKRKMKQKAMLQV